MLKVQVIILVFFGVGVLGWGARLDIKNHRKEKREAQLTQSDARS